MGILLISICNGTFIIWPNFRLKFCRNFLHQLWLKKFCCTDDSSTAKPASPATSSSVHGSLSSYTWAKFTTDLIRFYPANLQDNLKIR